MFTGNNAAAWQGQKKFYEIEQRRDSSQGCCPGPHRFCAAPIASFLSLQAGFRGARALYWLWLGAAARISSSPIASNADSLALVQSLRLPPVFPISPSQEELATLRHCMGFVLALQHIGYLWLFRPILASMPSQEELAVLRHCMGFGLALRQLQPAGQLAVFRSQVSLSSTLVQSAAPYSLMKFEVKAHEINQQHGVFRGALLLGLPSAMLI